MYVRQLFEIEEYKKNKIKNNCLFKKNKKLYLFTVITSQTIAFDIVRPPRESHNNTSGLKLDGFGLESLSKSGSLLYLIFFK